MSVNKVTINNSGLKVVTVGTQGPRGISGSLNDINDVAISNPQADEVIKYDASAGAFVNSPQENLTDGGNF